MSSLDAPCLGGHHHLTDLGVVVAHKESTCLHESLYLSLPPTVLLIGLLVLFLSLGLGGVRNGGVDALERSSTPTSPTLKAD
eukprot:10714359-Prorocentrum_lima.AAC.1